MEDDKKKPYKAYAATALTFAASFVTFWIADVDPLTAKEAAGGLVTAAVAAGLTGGVTYRVRNPQK